MFAQNAIGFWSSEVVAPSYPACLDDGHHWWYDGTDLTQITKDGSNLVSEWHSKGVADRTLLQATGTNQPLWVAGGTIRFDGADDFLKSAAFTWNQPCYVYLLFKQITWTSGDTIIDGNTGSYLRLYQATASPNLALYVGSAINSNPKLALETWGIIRFLTNGANSKLITNDYAAVTGNVGTRNAGGLTIGRRGNINDYYANIEVKDIVCVDIDDAANETEIYNWLVTRKP